MATKGKHMAPDEIGLFIIPEETDELGDTHDLSAAKEMIEEDKPICPDVPKYLIPDKVYDILKWVGLVVCYALAIFVDKVGHAWKLPNVDAIVTTIEATGLLIGMCIGASQLSFMGRQQ